MSRPAAIACLALAAALVAMRADAAPPAAPRNLVLISIDTLNRNALRAFAPTAPALPAFDALAAQSARFTHAYSTASWTLPAHASAMTGLYPWRHGARHPHAHIAAGATTLAAELRRHGFETVALTGDGYLNWYYGFRTGFDFYDGQSDGPPWPRAAPRPRAGAPNPPDAFAVAPFDRALAYLAQRPDDRPFFLFAHTYLVHNYHYPRTCDVPSPLSPIVRLDSDDSRCIEGLAVCSPEQWTHIRDLYDGEVRYVDEQLGQLLAALAAPDLRDTTLVVLMSDHGEGFDPEHGRITHAARVNADVARIPLLVRGPGIAAGEIDTPTSLIDLLPTILTLLGLPLPDGLDGRPVLGAPPPAPRPLFVTEHHQWWTAHGKEALPEPPDRPIATAVIDGPLWYIVDRHGEELYDMPSDPLQYHNLVAGGRTVPPALRRAAAGVGAAVPAAPVTPDAALAERLRALGYGR